MDLEESAIFTLLPPPLAPIEGAAFTIRSFRLQTDVAVSLDKLAYSIAKANS